MSSFVWKGCFSLSAAILVAGCAAGHWVLLKHGQPADVAETRADTITCERDAAITYPFAPVTTSKGGGSSSRSQTNCSSFGDSLDCVTYGGGNTAPTVTTSDGNERSRKKFYESCMAALGYEKLFIRDRTASANAVSADSQAVRRSCEKSADCQAGQNCRSTSGGGTECRWLNP